jgi:hypothetical protein
LPRRRAFQSSKPINFFGESSLALNLTFSPQEKEELRRIVIIRWRVRPIPTGVCVISRRCRPAGAGFYFGFGGYKDFAPTALGRTGFQFAQIREIRVNPLVFYAFFCG